MQDREALEEMCARLSGNRARDLRKKSDAGNQKVDVRKPKAK
jgi:hypothetical protein